MTTGQLARATKTPDRTVRYRMDRLHDANLVDCARPGRESGSAPRHWWLRPAGARLVAGVAAAEGRPSPMFAAHAAAITEVWLAVVENGPGVGIEPESWLTDRAGWQEWDGGGTWSRRYRLTPDAVARLSLAGTGTGTVFIEVDLASMTQTLLRQKVDRYLAYAADRAWHGVHPHCPPLLLLTTTPTRAATFVRAAKPLVDQYHRRHVVVGDPADAPVVAASGLVRDPARAITGACWMLPDTAAGELTLAEIISERLDAQAESAEWHAYQDTVVRRRADLDELDGHRSFDGLADWLGSEQAVEALQALVGSEPAAFLDGEPGLARQVIDWTRERRKVGRFEARELAEPLVAALEERHAALWDEQARRLLVAKDHLATGHPRLCRLAATLAAGRLVDHNEIKMLDTPPTLTRDHLQHQAYGDYLTRRADAVDRIWRGLSRRARRSTSHDALAAHYDIDHLMICATCGLAQPREPGDDQAVDHCPHCEGRLLDWADRDNVTSLCDRLDAIRHRLTATPSRRSPI